MKQHVCTPETCPEPGCYFVTCVESDKFWKMSGPYSTHAAALADVDKALEIANKHDGRAWFMSWGTARFESTVTGIGILNQRGLLELPASPISAIDVPRQ